MSCGRCSHTRPHSPRSAPMVAAAGRDRGSDALGASGAVLHPPHRATRHATTAHHPCRRDNPVHARRREPRPGPFPGPRPLRHDPRQRWRPHVVRRGQAFCLGAALARAEVQVAATRLLQRCPALRLDPDRPSAPRGFEFRAPPTLHVLVADVPVLLLSPFSFRLRRSASRGGGSASPLPLHAAMAPPPSQTRRPSTRSTCRPSGRQRRPARKMWTLPDWRRRSRRAAMSRRLQCRRRPP